RRHTRSKRDWSSDVCSSDLDLRAAFGAAARRYLPDVADEDLTPDISGVRAKLQAKGEPVRDFVIQEESARGRPGLVNLVGIDSRSEERRVGKEWRAGWSPCR